ncbi:MAG: DUF350 domain-containing protein [Elusimicrobiales bacterium]|nr:DUF350 domain-containing protein [Elusimicrobiales bacterium]
MNYIILFATVIYALLGLFLFVFAYYVCDKVMPKLEITKILVEDKNVGLGLVIAGMFIGIAIIIAAAIK